MNDSELITLRIFKEEALECMANDERHIASLNERIQVLEFHLGKLRDLLYLGFSNTVGVLPIEFVKDDAAAKRKSVKRERAKATGAQP